MPNTSHGRTNKKKIKQIIEKFCHYGTYEGYKLNNGITIDGLVTNNKDCLFISYVTQIEKGTAEKKITDKINNLKEAMENNNLRVKPIYGFIVLEGNGFSNKFIESQNDILGDHISIISLESFITFCESGEINNLFNKKYANVNTW